MGQFLPAGYGAAVPEWDAEVAIDEELVRALLRDQFPELDAGSATPLGEGWDNAVWLVEERWAFRFPRRQIAIPGVERELTVLPRLASLLPVPIPEPRFVGAPSERFPWPFFGAAVLPGKELADAGLAEDARFQVGAELGRFLRLLHAPDTAAQVDPERALPIDFNRRADMGFRVPRTRERLAELGRPETADIAELLAEAEALPPSADQVLVHGDLHVRHVLVDGASMSGVIDWGDVCVGDRAVDLQLVWSLLPATRRESFFAEYGPVDRETSIRAKVLAVYLCAMLALYGSSVAHASLARESLAGLERALEG
jgi:aminoglycoside phosphotransferase (APT) family kinase protein